MLGCCSELEPDPSSLHPRNLAAPVAPNTEATSFPYSPYLFSHRGKIPAVPVQCPGVMEVSAQTFLQRT